MKNGTKIVGALLIGAAAGVLLAPRSGKKTRKMISDKAVDVKGNINDTVNETISNITEKAKEKLSKVSSN